MMTGARAAVIAAALALAPATGGAQEAGVSLSPSSRDFGALDLPISSSTEVFRIANPGETEIEVSDISLSDRENFTLNVSGGESPCGRPPFALGPGESCTVEVTFKPLRERLYSATLTATSSDPPGTKAEAQLSGLGVMCGC